MATTGILYPINASENVVSGSSGTWTNHANMTGSSTTTFGVWTPPTTASYANFITLTGYGFNIPAGATIQGVRVTMHRRALTASNIRLRANGIWLSSSSSGANLGTTKSPTTVWPTTAATETHGSISDLWGNTSLTPAQVNSTAFGMTFHVERYAGTASSSASVARIGIEIEYDLPPTFSINPSAIYEPGRTYAGPNSSPVTISFQATDNSTAPNALSYEIKNTITTPGGTIYTSGTCTSGVTKTDTINWSQIATTGTLPTSVYVHVIDPMGGRVISPATPVRRDAVAPAAPTSVSVDPAGDLITKSWRVTFTPSDSRSTAVDDMSWQVWTGAGQTGTLLGSGDATSGTAITTPYLNDTGLVDGPNTRYLITRDGAWNIDETTIPLTYISNTAPTVTIAPTVSYTPLTRLGPNNTPATVSFTATDAEQTAANALSYTIRTAAAGGGTLVGTGTTTSGISKSHSITNTNAGLVDGTNTLYLRISDGTAFSSDSAFTLLRDTGLPTVGTITHTPNPVT